MGIQAAGNKVSTEEKLTVQSTQIYCDMYIYLIFSSPCNFA